MLTNAGDEAAEPGNFERDASLRLLRHYAASVTHRQYHDVEIVTVRVAPPARE